MDKNDRKIRKQWLALWLVSIFASVAASLISYKFDPNIAAISNQSPRFLYWCFFIPLLGSLGFSWLSFRCVYQKSGTRFLTFMIVVAVLNLIATPLLFWSGKVAFPTYIPHYGVYLCLTQIFGVCWLVACWRMRKVNKKLQFLKASLASSAGDSEVG